MGGKKKTKWRKLPLAEFTKECPDPPTASKNEYKQDLSRDKERPPPPMQSYEELTVHTNQYNEYGEYKDVSNLLYPTPYVVYNPMEMPVYPSYMMPPDASYYYIPPVQEYAPVTYHEYIPPVKDTVYLLLPAPAVRSFHERRYEGFAESAVIPEEDRWRRRGSYVNFSRNNYHSSHPKTMTSFSERNSSSREEHKRVQEFNEKKFIVSGEQVQMTQNVGMSQEDRNENLQDKQNLRRKQEICGVHIPRASEKKKVQNNSDVSFQEKQSKLKYSQDDVPSIKKLQDSQKQVQEVKENDQFTAKPKYQDTEIPVLREMEKTREQNANNMTNTDLNISKPSGNPLHNSDKHAGERTSVQNSNTDVITTLVKTNENVHYPNSIKAEKHNLNEVELPSPLPDILQKTVPYKSKTTSSRNNDKQSEYDESSPSNEKFSKFNMPYHSHSLNSDLSSHDTESALKSLTNLQSLRANQSIYKLAYDESITDQSEADSRSPSPVDPETQVPRSIINDEILIHEADSCSDAGSEDVELIPHRYESETFLNESKHMYVNKLSLAVELLRTQESLPYDEQFKRVSGESNLNFPGEMNLGFIDDSSSLEDNVITSQSQTRSSAAVSSFSIEDACNDSCEEAKEVVVEAANTQDNSEGVRAGYRRFQVQFHHYFSPRSALVNPCLCCVIM